MEYSKAADDIAPVFDDCPSFCYAFNKPATKFCGNCPVGIERRAFEKETVSLLDERLPGKWQKYGFDYLFQMVLLTLELESLPVENQTVVVSRCIGVLHSERNRMRRTDDWNRRAAAKP